MKADIFLHKGKSNLVFEKASEFLINWLSLYHNITQKTLLLLSGGSVVNLYRKLAEFLETANLDFSFLTFAQVDERFQPKQALSVKRKALRDKSDINSEVIKETGLWKICRKKKIPYYLVSQRGTLEKSTEQYNKIIEKLFKEYVYKIALLGIGEDGHTAGLLPGYEKLWNRNTYIAGYENKGQFKKRITLTPRALKKLDQAIVVAKGHKKRQVIQEILKEGNLENLDRYPAALQQKIPKVDLFTDINDIKFPGLSI